MPLLMTDVAAGSNAGLQLQRNMAAAPDVQQTQTNVMQEQANTLQQQQQNIEKTKQANIVADIGIKTDADIRNKIQNLIKDDSYIKSSPSDQVLKMASIVGESGKPEDMAKLIDASERITARELLNQSKKTAIERQAIADASSVFELTPDNQVNNRFNSLPEETRNLITSRVGPENWKNFSPVEKKAVIKNLFETGDNKLKEQQFANNLALAQIRSNERLLAQRQRDDHSEKVRNSTRDENARMWGVVTSALDRVQREPDRIKERERLDEEVAKAETKALESTYFRSYKPEGSNTEFYSKPTYDKYMQAIRKRDKHIAAQLDEEEAIIKTLPAAAGTLKQSQLDKIERQRGTLQLEEPGAKKKTEATPTVSTDAKTHDGFPARKNADGSYSTEVSITVTNPKLNDGKPTNIPSLWGGKEVDENTAVENALATGKKYESFPTIPEAVKAAKKRSDAGGAGATSNKYTQDNPAKPTSKEEYDKLPPNSYYMQDGVLKRKKG